MNTMPKSLYSKGGAKKSAAKKKFKPHMMYDPKTGKGYKAKVMADHTRMKKKGYGHTKPKMQMGGNMTNPAAVLGYFNDIKEQKLGGQYMQLGGAAVRGGGCRGGKVVKGKCMSGPKRSGDGLNIGGKGKVKAKLKRIKNKLKSKKLPF